MTPKTFIAAYSNNAKTAASGTNIFPETILSAAALESGYGASALAAQHNNFFGIKADENWTGKTATFLTKEQREDGSVFTVLAKFRHYDSPIDSFKNYVHFISGPRYVKAGVLSAKTPAQQFAALKKAGYATDKNYVDKLTNTLASLKDFILTTPAGNGLASLAFVGLLFF